jgi:hypothetical protein
MIIRFREQSQRLMWSRCLWFARLISEVEPRSCQFAKEEEPSRDPKN